MILASAKRAVAAGVAACAVLVGCSAPGAHQAAGQTVRVVAPALPTPMVTSVPTPAGTWATVPMGRLGETLNTFWQLFWHPGSAKGWSNQVEATATATNGGLVLAAGRQGELAVGIRPSSYLTFTPFVYTLHQSRTWKTGLLDDVLAARPDALALGPGGHALALASGKTGSTVLQSAAGLSGWQTVSDRSALERSADGRSCGIGTVTSVGYVGAQPAIGTSCERTGTVGLFVPDHGTWTAAGPTLPASVGSARAEVLGLQDEGSTTVVLLALTTRRGVSLMTGWRHAAGSWTVTAPLSMPAGGALDSYGSDGGGGEFVLETSGGSLILETAQPSSRAWRTLPAPPEGTATVAFNEARLGSAASSVEALSGSATVLDVWALGASGVWSHTQTMHVPVQFGSSAR